MSLASAVTRDGWSYSGELHVEASNNRHRRATLPELKAVFDGSDGAKDRPAHWYEAQLIHYGLPPSKTKGTAKMRLFDAVSQGNLAVPSHILKTENELKKEWAKREREAKQALKKPTATAAKTSKKRKAEDGHAGVASGTNVNINISVSVGAQGNVQVVNAGPASKKAKTGSTATKSTVTKSAAAKATATKATTSKATAGKVTATKSTTAKATPAKATTAKATAAKATATKATVTKATVTKSTITKSTTTKSTITKSTTTKSTPAKATSAKSTPAKATPAKKAAPAKATPAKATPAKATPTRKPQTARRGTTARRSRPFNPVDQGRPTPAAVPQPQRFDATPAQWDNIPNGPPPPYSGSNYDDDGYDDDGYDDDGHDSDGYDDDGYDDHGYDNRGNDNEQDSLDGDGPLPSLGLLNGRYELRCADYEEDWGIVFTLDGNALWGSFEIGPLSGILRFAERPWASSRQRLYFEWRGADDEGETFVETDDGSYIVFMGGGVVVGELCFYGRMLEFEGCRVSGQETRSEVSVGDVRRRWESRW